MDKKSDYNIIISNITNKYNNQWLPTPDGEEKIIWLEDISRFSFVRTRVFWSRKRTTKPIYFGNGQLLGYSTTGQESKPNYVGYFERRYFYLQAIDLKPECVYLRTGSMPAEGVNPLTVRAGIWGSRNGC